MASDGNDYNVDAEAGVPRGEGESWGEAAERLQADGMGDVAFENAFWRKQHRRQYRDSDRRDCGDYVDLGTDEYPIPPHGELAGLDEEVTVRV